MEKQLKKDKYEEDEKLHKLSGNTIMKDNISTCFQ